MSLQCLPICIYELGGCGPWRMKIPVALGLKDMRYFCGLLKHQYVSFGSYEHLHIIPESIRV